MRRKTILIVLAVIIGLQLFTALLRLIAGMHLHVENVPSAIVASVLIWLFYNKFKKKEQLPWQGWVVFSLAILLGYTGLKFMLKSLLSGVSGSVYLSYILFFSLFIGLGVFLYFRYRKRSTSKEETASMALAGLDSYFSIYTAKGTEYIMGNPFRGILVVGAAGSGKSASVVRQLMYNAVNKNFCGLLYDFKYPTLTNELNGYLYFKQSQARHYNINFTHIEKSVRINPLKSQYVPNSSYAREYAMAIINNLIPESTEKQDFWTRSCIDLLTAEIHYLAQEHPELSSLPHVVALTFTDEDKLIQLLSQNTECLGMIKSLETALRNQAKNQLSGVVSTLQSALSRINTPEIFWVLSGNDISLNINDPQNPIWLSVGNDPGLADTFAPVISLIFTVALKQMNQPNKHKSIVIVDEAPTVFIPNVDRIPATARSNKVSFVFCAQDISQIEKGYGKTNTDVLLSNLNNQFYGRLSSPKSAEHVSKMFGKDDFLYSSESQSSSSGQSFTKGQSKSFSYRERDRVRPQELLNFDPGKFAGFLVESNKKEFIATLKEEMYYIMETPVMHQNCSPKTNFKVIHDQIREMAGTKNNANFPPQNEQLWQQENNGYLSFNA